MKYFYDLSPCFLKRKQHHRHRRSGMTPALLSPHQRRPRRICHHRSINSFIQSKILYQMNVTQTLPTWIRQQHIRENQWLCPVPQGATHATNVRKISQQSTIRLKKQILLM